MYENRTMKSTGIVQEEGGGITRTGDDGQNGWI
jgi:hypothetical protein